jgi:hypothetical protein
MTMKKSAVLIAALALSNVALAQEAKKESALKLPEWVDRISLKGDVRYRVEHTDDSTDPNERTRDRLRARLNLDAKVADGFTVGLGLSTGENGDPRAGNQTLDGESSRKPAYFDLFFIDWAITSDLHAIGGKMKAPFFRPGQSLYFDNDINPEGLAVTYAHGSMFGSAYSYWIDENVINTGTTAGNSDTKIFGGQVGYAFKLGESKLTVAAMYSDLASGQNHRPFFNNTATGSNGNTVTGVGTAAVLTYDFQIAEVAVQWDAKVGSLPLQVWANASQNLDPDEYDKAWMVGAMLGKAANQYTWEFGLSYLSFEKDALFGQFVDSDFGGVTDSKSLVVRAGFAVRKNVVINLAYFDTDRGVDADPETEVKRSLLDLNLRF